MLTQLAKTLKIKAFLSSRPVTGPFELSRTRKVTVKVEENHLVLQSVDYYGEDRVRKPPARSSYRVPWSIHRVLWILFFNQYVDAKTFVKSFIRDCRF